MTRPLPIDRIFEESLDPTPVETLLDALNPRLLDMLVPEGRETETGRNYFGSLNRLVLSRGGGAEYEVRPTGDGRFRVTSEGGDRREILLTDSLHALELFILVDDLDESDRTALVAWLAERRPSPERDASFEHRWADGSWMRGATAVGYLPELVEEFDDEELVDVMEVVEHLRLRV